ncbi:unnamed protein product [Orchesella dallaii]|uniref:Cytoplasmic dynein 2 light intermediate chain 1 n=1 Tax=Orchesella dallaii TaxID=48710 RepID=A0ABP1RQQ4_9HEXA
MEKLLIFKQVNGKIIPLESNINKINEIKNFDSTFPIAFISLIGEKGSGKTTYTRLLAQNFRHNSSNGWLQKVDINSTSRNKVQPLLGFTPESSKNDEGESEISLWPEAFPIKIRGSIVMVLLFHLDVSEKDVTPESKASLEYLLCLLSSRIVEIHWKRDEFKFLKHYRDFKNDIRFKEHNEIICNNVIYLLRKPESEIETATNLTANGDEAKKLLIPKVTSLKGRTVLEEMSSVGIVHVPDNRKSFEKSGGYLKLSDALYDAIYGCINCLADDESIFPKHFPKKDVELIGENLNKFLRICVNITNTKNGHYHSEIDDCESNPLPEDKNYNNYYAENPVPKEELDTSTTNENRKNPPPEEFQEYEDLHNIENESENPSEKSRKSDILGTFPTSVLLSLEAAAINSNPISRPVAANKIDKSSHRNPLNATGMQNVVNSLTLQSKDINESKNIKNTIHKQELHGQENIPPQYLSSPPINGIQNPHKPPPPPPPPPSLITQPVKSRTPTACKPTESRPSGPSLQDILSRRSSLRRVDRPQNETSKPTLSSSNPPELVNALITIRNAMSGIDNVVPNGTVCDQNDDANENDPEWKD